MYRLDFEKPIIALEMKIQELRNISSHGKIGKVDISQEVKTLEEKLSKMKKDIYSSLTPWQKIQVARHPQRPYTFDYIRMMCTDFVELHGDRLFADDFALVGGLAKIEDKKVLIMGHQKGRDIKENVMRNFGCAHPEGYRKAIRLMRIAEKMNIPVVIFIDTPGAYPGIGAEERGQAQAIAENLRDMMEIATPIVATVIGEGGSGGALGIGIADKVCILQNAYYSVISPEGCASILWRNSLKAPDAAEALKLTGDDLIKFGIVDEIIPEPLGGAHREPEKIAEHVKKTVLKYLKSLSSLKKNELLSGRYDRFRKIGAFVES